MRAGEARTRAAEARAKEIIMGKSIIGRNRAKKRNARGERSEKCDYCHNISNVDKNIRAAGANTLSNIKRILLVLPFQIFIIVTTMTKRVIGIAAHKIIIDGTFD